MEYNRSIIFISFVLNQQQCIDEPNLTSDDEEQVNIIYLSMVCRLRSWIIFVEAAQIRWHMIWISLDWWKEYKTLNPDGFQQIQLVSGYLWWLLLLKLLIAKINFFALNIKPFFWHIYKVMKHEKVVIEISYVTFFRGIVKPCNVSIKKIRIKTVSTLSVTWTVLFVINLKCE